MYKKIITVISIAAVMLSAFASSAFASSTGSAAINQSVGSGQGDSSLIVTGETFGTDIKATVTLNNSFAISPNIEGDDAFISAATTIKNETACPIVVTAVSCVSSNSKAPRVVEQDSKDWDNLGKTDTAKYIALGYKNIQGGSIGTTSPDFFFQDESVDTNRELFTLKNGETGSMVMQGKFGRAWASDVSGLEYNITVKLEIMA